ncbi:hypothetical protein SteCoe_38254 [Stentor coeruleus]|uniref:Uncharacterized protein n=1 Tax=Stentor coeruleus TaxID=5963 RepID=A0A1R2ALP3_9CILI|nr:hypothetical protein SteCoe_38254 [Stentor coeruleus]
MRRSSEPRRQRFQNLNWISVEESTNVDNLRNTQKLQMNSLFTTTMFSAKSEKEQVSEDFPQEIFENHTKNDFAKRNAGSVIPRSSNFVNYSSGKYYCPYYIKPKDWKTINSAPRFDERKEIKKINEFYKYMHAERISPNPFKNQNFDANKTYEVTKQKISELPTLKKYKMYLVEKRIRVPAFLEDI